MNIKVTKNIKEATHITHGGCFHADEVLATVMFAALEDITVARVYTVSENTEAVVYDIGGGKYDHHQKNRNCVRKNGIPFSSCSLIWRDYGEQVLRASGCPESLIDTVKMQVDHNLLEGIDGTDNGIQKISAEAIQKYEVLDFPATIGQFNPTWDDSTCNPDEAFIEACIFAEGVLRRTIKNEISNAKAICKVEDAIMASTNHIMVLPQYIPWKDILFRSQSKKAGDLWYVVFPSRRGDYSVQCVPDLPGSFGQRHPFPTEWSGNPEASGVKGCTFIHSNGFIAACDTLDHALKFAYKAVGCI